MKRSFIINKVRHKTNSHRTRYKTVFITDGHREKSLYSRNRRIAEQKGEDFVAGKISGTRFISFGHHEPPPRKGIHIGWIDC